MNNKGFFFTAVAVLAAAMFSTTIVSCKKDKSPEPEPQDTTPVVITCTTVIESGCLDDWQNHTEGDYTYYEPAGNFLRTLNMLSALPPEIGGPGPVTTEKTTDAYSGTYAAKLVSKNFCPSQNSCIFIPGLLGATVLDIPGQTIRLGKPYTDKPLRFTGFYRYYPVAGDSALIEVLLTKYNTSLGKRDTVAITKNILKNEVSTYTAFDYSLNYLNPGLTPDTVTILCVSSAGINFSSLTQCQGQPGSILYIDDIDFIMP